MIRNKMMWTLLILFSMISIAFIGCGGGGGDSNKGTTDPKPALKVLPADYDFGIVTGSNSAKTLEVTIQNAGTADLGVSNIVLSDTSNFNLNLNAGATPCASITPTIPAGSSCTATVDFTPTATNSFSADLTIQSNDPTTPVYVMGLTGIKQDIESVNVKINQINACPRPDATAYVSVTDQGGFPVNGLVASNFTVTEGGSGVVSASSAQVDASSTLSVALLMDYSGSIVGEPDNVTDMQNAASSFIKQLGTNDEAEIIKYATDIEVTQGFTSDQTLLLSAITSTPSNIGDHTALYDAVDEAIGDFASSTKDRRAIIIITDGMDDDGNGNQISQHSLQNVIDDANASGVPVFTVGIADADAMVLQPMAGDTGGIYSDSKTSDNLATIFQQLGDILFADQYVLTYTSGLSSTATGNLTVNVEYTPASTLLTGSDTRESAACTP